MAFKDLPEQEQGVQLLQRSLERRRLAHGYLFTGDQLGELETLARTLAKTLNCQRPVRPPRQRSGPDAQPAAIDCCDHCLACQKIEHGNHADVHWVRPESKSRVITIDQMRDLMQEINLKPTEAEYKVCVIVAADRLNEKAANAFLKTLEEPPARSVLILLTTEPQRMLETILSRCLRLNFAGEGPRHLAPAQMEWLAAFSDLAAAERKSLLGRYRLMDVISQKLSEAKATIEETLTARSPLQRYSDVEKELQEKWEEELKAAIEAEYRRQRADLLLVLQWWLRDVWFATLQAQEPAFSAGRRLNAETDSPGQDALLTFPHIAGTRRVAARISARDATENLRILEQLQRRLGTNVQEALALEVSLLKLHL